MMRSWECGGSCADRKTVFASAERQRGIDTCSVRAFLEKPTDKAYSKKCLDLDLVFIVRLFLGIHV